MAVLTPMTNMNLLLLEIGKMSKTGIKVKLVGQDGNIFNLTGLCREALRANTRTELQFEKLWWDFFNEIQKCKSYEEALCVMMDWFEVK